MRRHLPLLASTLVLLVGCQATAPTPVKPRPRPSGTDARQPGAIDALRRIAQEGVARTLTGKVKLISDHGAGIVSNNGGTAISENGAGAISENGAGLVSNNGGGLVSKAKYALRQAPAEALLADATIEVLDGAGRALADAAGKPIEATTDRRGAFRLQAALPAEALVLRVRVAKAGLLPGGELRAIVPKDAGASAPTDVDTAASLGASYVLAKFVKGERAVLDKLPAAEATRLHDALGGALGKLGGRPGLEPADQVAAAERLRGEDAGVRGSLERIEAILLAGVEKLGVGLPATSVALMTPSSLAFDVDGALLVAERVPGRIRRIRADGTMDMLVDAEQGAWKFNFGALKDIHRGPDGLLYAVEHEPRRIQAIGADGRPRIVAGLGAPAGPAGELATNALAFDAEGRLVIALQGPRPDGTRLVSLGADGTVAPIPFPAEIAPGLGVAGVAVATDGATWVLSARPERGDAVLARRGADGAWRVVASDLRAGEYASIRPDAGGTLLVGEDEGNRVLRFGPDGDRTVVAGTGASGLAPDGSAATRASLGRPGGLVRAADGTLYLAERGASLVRAVDPDGRLRTVAGASGVVRVGDALAVSMAAPGGMALDPQGRLMIAETGASLIRVFDGESLAILGGSVEGFAGDGGPLAAAWLNEPTGLTYAPDGALWIADSSRVRRVDPAGIIQTLSGGGEGRADATNAEHRELPGARIKYHDMAGIAIGPDGAAYVASNRGHQIIRVAPDGATRVVAGGAPPGDVIPRGSDGGDGGLATAAGLNMPFGVAFRPGASPPELFVADAGNLRIRKVIDPGGPAPRIETVAGLPLAETFVKLVADPAAALAGPTPAAETALVFPIGLCFDAAGDLYVTEGGTKALLSRGGGYEGFDVSGLPQIGSRVRRIALSQPGAPVTTVAGPGGRVLAGTGDAGLYFGVAIAFDRLGRLVVADVGANQLKLIPAEALK